MPPKQRDEIMELELPGQYEAVAEIVLRQIRRRLGDIPESLALRMDDLTFEALGDLGEALLEFTSFADLETWLNDRR